MAGGGNGPPEPLPIDDLRLRLDEAQTLLAAGRPDLAVLLASSGLEGLARIGVARRDPKRRALDALGIIAWATSLGYVDDDDYADVYRSWGQRSAVVHGLAPSGGDPLPEVAAIFIKAARTAARSLAED